MKAKVGIVGHFGIGKNFYDGQTIKTKILYKELKERLGNQQLQFIDTYNWKKRLLKTLKSALHLGLKSENIIINTSVRGRNFFIPLLYLLSRLFNVRIYCMVIGGGFPTQMKNNKFVNYFSKRINGIFVETNTMARELEILGYRNVSQLNNFKDLEIIKLTNDNTMINLPLKLCTFSRVVKEKGIEDIINAVKKINEKEQTTIFTLDIYGQIDPNYHNDFIKQIENFPEYIEYKGIVEYDKSVDILKNYFLLVFPTLYKTEGVPGTIIDAYASGLPVLASNWDSCHDVVDDNETGFIFEMGDVDDLVNKLLDAYLNYDQVLKMKQNCLRKANEYSTEYIIPKLIKKLNEK